MVGRHHQLHLERSTLEEYLYNVGTTLILELKTREKIAAKPNDSSEKFSRSEAIE